jgi:hypothetical protein
MADPNRLSPITHLQLASRNLVRNRRRTLITLLTMIFGISTLTLLSALNESTATPLASRNVMSNPVYWGRL